ERPQTVPFSPEASATMSDEAPQVPPDLARQLRQHLDSLRAAGVSFLPTAPLPAPEGPAPPAPAPTLPASHLPAATSAPPPPADDDVEKRLQELTVLAQRVSECQRCPHLASTRTQTVFGV